MATNKKDVCCFDVDGTIIKWKPDVNPVYSTYSGAFLGPSTSSEEFNIKLDFYGTPKYVREIKVHTEFLKSLKARGYFIRVHSGNGAEWAEQVVNALGLKDHVDSIETKPVKFIDDKPMENWAHPIYLGDT